MWRDRTLQWMAQPVRRISQISNIAGAQPLASGSHIVVRSGQARVSLEGGGEIAICGAARLQLLSSGGALTVVLEYGTLDLHLNGARTISIYTPLIVATPVVIGGEDTDTSVGLSPDGKMCLYALNGALRISQQLSGQEILIPQNGHASLSGGQVESLAAPIEACVANSIWQSSTLQGPSASIKASGCWHSKRAAAPGDVRTSAGAVHADINRSFFDAASGQLPQPSSPAPPRPAAVDEPVYKVLMPPLSFDPNAPVNISEPSTDQIVLIRSVHVQDETVYRDVVEPKKKRGRTVIYLLMRKLILKPLRTDFSAGSEDSSTVFSISSS